MKKYALIVAGGKGLRMGSEIPKQFLPIGVSRKVVLMHTLEAFHHYDPELEIVLVLPAEQQAYWKGLCKKAAFTVPYALADGRETRFHSVKNGLSFIPSEGIVAVHDGVRPFVSKTVIEDCFRKAEIYKAVIPVVDVVETVRELLDTGGSKTVDRRKYKLVQTPQTFDVQLLKAAYNQPYTPFFTDDASVVEAMEVPVFLTEGNRENIKITTPFDLKIAEAVL